MRIGFIFVLTVSAILLSTVQTIKAQANLPLYTDNLVNGFQNWSWASVNLANTSPTHSGNHSISVTDGENYQALYLEHSDFNTSPYQSLDFWINGGASGGQKLQAFGVLDGTSQRAYSLGTLETNVWQHFTIPLSSLGVADQSNFSGIWIQGSIYDAQPVYYVDDIQLIAAPAPSLVHLSVNATQSVRSVESRWFGVNAAVWDNYFDTSQTISLLKEMGARIMRFPGGSLSDEYHWDSPENIRQWPTSFDDFAHVATNANVRAQAFITANYGTGTPEEAAAWVHYSNLTNHYDFKYWEIGNECYGTWETDSNTYPHDAYTYAVRAAAYITAMKAADPTVKIGVPVVTGEDSSVNGYTNHPVVNPRTGQTHYGWTPVLLSTLKNLGVLPDYLIYHVYPEYTDSESDPLLLQSATSWPVDAANLRQLLADYLGSAATNIELVADENNSNSGNQGKQSTSLVNGLYYADSLGQLMKTEFNSFVWWDLRNGTDTGGNFDPTLYGWRTYGDLGMVNGPTNRDPAFYAAKLMSCFAQPGDTVLNAASDYLLLSAYAIRSANGAVRLLVLNKDTQANFDAEILLAGFMPDSAAVIFSYGIPQDEAARTNASYSLQDISTNTFAGAAAGFDYTFPPLSLTLFTFAPAAPQLAALGSQTGRLILQLQGQPDTTYRIQTSTNLLDWTAVSTNRLTGNFLDVTNEIPPGAGRQFWRACWTP